MVFLTFFCSVYNNERPQYLEKNHVATSLVLVEYSNNNSNQAKKKSTTQRIFCEKIRLLPASVEMERKKNPGTYKWIRILFLIFFFS